uniref:Pentacotripeptide-repeat region of PRORP domain-containing protein n=2 Tax=Amphora coffeiformis TaxID=265554 RepID=A0A7S3P439_9STRA
MRDNGQFRPGGRGGGRGRDFSFYGQASGGSDHGSFRDTGSRGNSSNNHMHNSYGNSNGNRPPHSSQPPQDQGNNGSSNGMQGFNASEWIDRLSSSHAHPNETLGAAQSRYPDAFSSGRAMTALIAAAARRRQIRLAYACWEFMDAARLEKNTYHYNAMISVAEKSKNLRHALDLLKEMDQRGIAKNEVTFSSAISASEKSGEWRVAMDLLDQMEREGVGRSTIAYNAAISACEKGMVPNRACEVFRRMKNAGIKPSVVSYSALISAAEKGGQWKLALDVLEEMKEAGFGANVVAYSAAISAVAKGGQWEIALRLFREIQASGGQPSIITFNATMTALEKGMKWELALDLFEEMKMRNMPITVVSYGSAISACDKGLQYRQCLEFLDEMTELGIQKNVVIFGAATSCMEKCCRPDISFQLMERMKLEGVTPNVHIYNSVISACARCDLWEKGFELFKEMDNARVQKDVVTYNSVLDAVSSQVGLGRSLFKEGVEKGFYSQVSKVGRSSCELALHFLSLGGGEIALGWWFEECLQPVFDDPAKFEAIETITIVTGYGKSRTRGRRHGNDGMKKRVQAMLGFMGIRETPQENAGRVRVDKMSLRDVIHRNNGRVMLDVDGYMAWKSRETTANHVPDVEQKIRARFKAQNPGSGLPPFIRVETENTSPEYRLEARRQSLDGADEGAAPPPPFEQAPVDTRYDGPGPDRRGPPQHIRRPMDGGRGWGGRGRGGRFNDRAPRGSPRGPPREFRRASSFDSPRGEMAPRNGSFEGQASPTTGDRESQPQDVPGTPTAAGLKRGYSDTGAPGNAASRGYDLDSPPATRQKLT